MTQHDIPTFVLGLDIGAGNACRAERRTPRSGAMRLVEYTPFPSSRADAAPRTGFTRDVSEQGLCVGADAPERVGTLLRVRLCDPDGLPGRAGVERVVWCERSDDGRSWLGLERVAGRAC